MSTRHPRGPVPAPLALALLLVVTPPVSAQEPQTGPIIDMHLHAGAIRSPEYRDSVMDLLAAHGIVMAALSVDDSVAAHWHEAAPETFLVGPAFPCFDGRYPQGDPCFDEGGGWPDLDWLRRQYEAGRMRTMGELLYVYYGIAPDDERLEPYWALAEELDIPVGVHIGRRPRESLPPGCCPHYDDDFGDPSLLAPVLRRHPDLRVWLMHAPGSAEWTDETIALMQAHPNVYAEMSIVNSVAPAPAHAGALRALLDAGLADRVMFGSDNRPIAPIIERIEAVPFLSPAQKRGIYCGNAARFLRLDEGVCAVE